MGVRTLVRRAAVIAAVLSLLALLSPSGGASAQPDAAGVAVAYVQANAAALGLTAGDVAEAAVADQVVSAHTGVTHVYLEQRHRGIPVAGGVVNVSVAANGRVLHVGNRFVPDLASATAGQDVARRATDATAAAARHVGLAPTEPLVVVDTEGGATRETTVSDGGVSAKPIPAELAWLPTGGGAVRLAWSVEIEPTDGEHWWTMMVDAETGAVLETDDLIVHDDPAAIANAIARPAATAQAIGPEETVDDGSSYRVFPLPNESPSDGDRALVDNPASALASPFGWHDTDGAAGPEFTRTRGNNVHAYTDRDNNNVRDPGSDPDGCPGI
jgi:hypothetical protein